MVRGETQQTGNDRKQLRPYSTTSGMLLASAAAPFAVLQGAFGSLSGAPALLIAGAVGAAALILLASLTITRRPLFGRIVVTLVIAGVLALALPLLVEAPVAALSALIASTAALAMLWRAGIPLMALAQGGRPAKEGRTQGAAIVALTVWIFWSFSGVHRSVGDALLVGWAMFSSSLLSLDWAIHNLKQHRARAVVVLAAAGVALATAIGPALRGNWWWMMSTLAGVAACSTVLLRRTPQSALQEVSWWEPLLGHPERLFVGTFAAMCAGGAALLALPYSAASGQSIGLIDALFTSTSAVCVTGLIVLDTPVDFSHFGQFVILALIQVGGLGIMTFSTVALLALGKRLSLTHEGAVASLISTRDRGQLFATAKRILQLTVVTETLGAALLAAAFAAHGDTLAMAAWRGLFTSISAFCNAGFALQSDSLVPYQQSPLVLHTVGALIIMEACPRWRSSPCRVGSSLRRSPFLRRRESR